MKIVLVWSVRLVCGSVAGCTAEEPAEPLPEVIQLEVIEFFDHRSGGPLEGQVELDYGGSGALTAEFGVRLRSTHPDIEYWLSFDVPEEDDYGGWSAFVEAVWEADSGLGWIVTRRAFSVGDPMRCALARSTVDVAFGFAPIVDSLPDRPAVEKTDTLELTVTDEVYQYMGCGRE